MDIKRRDLFKMVAGAVVAVPTVSAEPVDTTDALEYALSLTQLLVPCEVGLLDEAGNELAYQGYQRVAFHAKVENARAFNAKPLIWPQVTEGNYLATGIAIYRRGAHRALFEGPLTRKMALIPGTTMIIEAGDLTVWAD